MDDVQRPAVTWKEQGACVDLPVDIFFPLPGPKFHKQVQAAKSVCASCPVQARCLEYAMDFVKGRYITLPGIYGGLTEPERWKLARTRVINTH